MLSDSPVHETKRESIAQRLSNRLSKKRLSKKSSISSESEDVVFLFTDLAQALTNQKSDDINRAVL